MEDYIDNYTVEDYTEFQKEAQELTQVERVGLIIRCFVEFTGNMDRVSLQYDADAARPFIFCFADKNLFEDIVREITMIVADPSRLTCSEEEALEKAKEQLQAYRVAPKMCSVIRALSRELGCNMGVVDMTNPRFDYKIIVKSREHWNYLTGQKEMVN
jgi:hypothetical protein